ncbi:MAG: hypothetical protein ABIJ65_00065, partial [Chloroflexota bacterium]
MKKEITFFLVWIELTVLLSACSLISPFSPVETAPGSTPTVLLVPSSTLEIPAATLELQATGVGPIATSASVFPDGANYFWNLITAGFKRPVGLANAGDGTGRLFVVEQAGIIHVV